LQINSKHAVNNRTTKCSPCCPWLF